MNLDGIRISGCTRRSRLFRGESVEQFLEEGRCRSMNVIFYPQAKVDGNSRELKSPPRDPFPCSSVLERINFDRR